ncbi:MAG: hypothetical protein FWC41_01890, partial [Firmicutes bacterium]|nr:hypothetical protein [Bacillota bacterium]
MGNKFKKNLAILFSVLTFTQTTSAKKGNVPEIVASCNKNGSSKKYLKECKDKIVSFGKNLINYVIEKYEKNKKKFIAGSVIATIAGICLVIKARKSKKNKEKNEINGFEKKDQKTKNLVKDESEDSKRENFINEELKDSETEAPKPDVVIDYSKLHGNLPTTTKEKKEAVRKEVRKDSKRKNSEAKSDSISSISQQSYAVHEDVHVDIEKELIRKDSKRKNSEAKSDSISSISQQSYAVHGEKRETEEMEEELKGSEKEMEYVEPSSKNNENEILTLLNCTNSFESKHKIFDFKIKNNKLSAKTHNLDIPKILEKGFNVPSVEDVQKFVEANNYATEILNLDEPDVDISYDISIDDIEKKGKINSKDSICAAKIKKAREIYVSREKDLEQFHKGLKLFNIKEIINTLNIALQQKNSSSAEAIINILKKVNKVESRILKKLKDEILEISELVLNCIGHYRTTEETDSNYEDESIQISIDQLGTGQDIFSLDNEGAKLILSKEGSIRFDGDFTSVSNIIKIILENRFKYLHLENYKLILGKSSIFTKSDFELLIEKFGKENVTIESQVELFRHGKVFCSYSDQYIEISDENSVNFRISENGDVIADGDFRNSQIDSSFLSEKLQELFKISTVYFKSLKLDSIQLTFSKKSKIKKEHLSILKNNPNVKIENGVFIEDESGYGNFYKEDGGSDIFVLKNNEFFVRNDLRNVRDVLTIIENNIAMAKEQQGFGSNLVLTLSKDLKITKSDFDNIISKFSTDDITIEDGAEVYYEEGYVVRYGQKNLKLVKEGQFNLNILADRSEISFEGDLGNIVPSLLNEIENLANFKNLKVADLKLIFNKDFKIKKSDFELILDKFGGKNITIVNILEVHGEEDCLICKISKDHEISVSGDIKDVTDILSIKKYGDYKLILSENSKMKNGDFDKILKEFGEKNITIAYILEVHGEEDCLICKISKDHEISVSDEIKDVTDILSIKKYGDYKLILSKNLEIKNSNFDKVLKEFGEKNIIIADMLEVYDEENCLICKISKDHEISVSGEIKDV